MAFDVLVARVEANLPITPSDIREVVKKLRFQRPYQIHEPAQYAFVCKIVDLVEPNKFWPIGSWRVETKKKIEKGFEKMSGRLTPKCVKNSKIKASNMASDSAQADTKSGKREA
ncbi:hypothetical protein Ddc_18281 [Ditylenchus destructor]|nr:hypothetical protein Ddc_18281 [Ditylenchus destructor]